LVIWFHLLFNPGDWLSRWFHRVRKGSRVAVGYLVLAWVVLQITDIVAPALRLPD
jgi:hypothetical protein